MSQVRDEAEALAKALEFGACDVAEAIAWSDAQLIRDDSPSAVLCEISLARDRYPQDVAALLRQYPGVPDLSRVQRLLVRMADVKLRIDPSRAYQIALALYHMALAEEIVDPRLKEIAWWAWDALDLAEAGYIQDTREEVVKQISAVLHDVSTETDVTWTVGAMSPDVT